MTRLTQEEDFALCSPEMIAADLRQGEIDGVWKPCAEKLGWFWSHAHGGFINEAFRRPNMGWEGYHVAHDAEDACFAAGVETLEEALKVLE